MQMAVSSRQLDLRGERELAIENLWAERQKGLSRGLKAGT